MPTPSGSPLLPTIAFTSTGAILITISGFVLARDLSGIFGPTWLTLGFSGFALSGLFWLTILIPTQLRQSRLARAAETSGAIDSEYWGLARRWYVFGPLATVLPVGTLFLMAIKP